MEHREIGACLRVPSIDMMTEVHQGLWGLLIEQASCSDVRSQEDVFLPLYLRLADALRPVRPLALGMEGWPYRVRLALPEIIEWFDDLTRHWGWEQLQEPEPIRDAYLSTRKARYQEEFVRPVLEAALSLQDGSKTLADCPWDDINRLAEQARSLGYRPTMSVQEAKDRFQDLETRRRKALWIGCAYPSIQSLTLPDGSTSTDFGVKVHAALGALRTEMVKIAPQDNVFRTYPNRSALADLAELVEDKAPEPSVPSETKPDPVTAPGQAPRRPKVPSNEMFEAYDMYTEVGDKQTTIAQKLSKKYHKPFSQGQISRWIKVVRAYKGEEKPARPKVTFIDSSKLDSGPRQQNNARRK